MGRTVKYALVSAAKDDQCTSQAVFGQKADHVEAIRAVHLQVAYRDIHTPSIGQCLLGILYAARRQHIEDLNAVEHLMECHQLESVVFKNQNIQ
ncbi:hypothetical protein D3C80_1870860 [compost metagenome]